MKSLLRTLVVRNVENEVQYAPATRKYYFNYCK